MRVISSTRNRVIRVDSEFAHYDFVITKRKDSEDSEFLQSIRGITSRFYKTNRNTFFNHLSSAPSPSTVLLLTTTANFISKTNTVLSHFSKADSHGKKRIVMVGQQSRFLQWWIGYKTTDTVPYSDRCIQKRLEGCVLRDQNRGSVVQEGTGSTYQSAGTSSHKVRHLDICQNMENVSYTYPIQVDNMTAWSYLLKMGGTKNPDLMQVSKEIWEFLLGQWITITAKHLPGNLNCKADWE